MAGVITHMVIAREIQKSLPEGTIKDMGLFYLGNLAPDSIHAREGYIRAYKKHTHFRDDIPDKDFEMPENRELFHERLSAFILKNRDRRDGLLDLYRGYVVHILTDELFMLTLRKEFCKAMEEQGICQTDLPFFQYIVADMNRNDLLLVERYDGCDEIRSRMEQVPIYPIEDYLSAQEISDSRDWLVKHHFYDKNEILEPVYISYESMLHFIRMAAADISQKLSDGISFPRMF
jgi:hypothetical protein